MGCNNNNHPLIDSSTTIRGCNNSCVPKNVNIVCKEIIIPEGQEIISVKGEKNANTRIFLIPKITSNGDDLSDKTFTILTEDSKGYQTSTLIAEKEIINNYIKIKWIIDETATITEGDLLVAIQASGDDFLWSTLPAKFTVADTIEVVEEGEIVIPSVVTKLQREVLQLQNSLYGGETNTVLTKKSNDNLDFQWKTVTIPDISAIYARIQEVENEIPSKTSELINDSEFVNSSSLDISVQKNVSISSIGDNVSLNETKVNLKTKVESATTEQIPLATSTHAGMMSSSDYSTLSSLTLRVQSLEGKTTRILYTSSVTKEDISIVSTTLLTAGSRLAAGSIISGKIVSEVVEIDEDTALDIGDVIKTGSILANASVVNDISYPTAQDIEEFIVSLGYEEPFESIAVVTINTYHIWHYYVNGGIGWRDDGVDTASNFTNETVGLIKGSESAGKVYAETDGTGSINGWDNLNNQVENTKNKVENLENISLYSTTEKVVGTWVDGKPLYRKTIQINNITALEGNIDISDAQDIMIDHTHSFFKQSIYTLPLDFYGGSSSDWNRTYIENGNKIVYKFGSAYTMSKNLTFTIEYTKTTD